MNETKMWGAFNKTFANFDKVFKELDRSSTFGQVTYRVTRTWTTDSTAEPHPAPTYSDGFTDGWNAHEATQ